MSSRASKQTTVDRPGARGDGAPTTSARVVAARRRGIRADAAMVPRPLAILLVVVAVLGVSWALINPPWQAPDEDVHFSYVQTLAELHRLPGRPGPPISAAQFAVEQAVNNDPIVFFGYARPEWSRQAADAARKRSTKASMRDAGGPNTAAGYPPAYYLADTPGYLLAGRTDVATKLYAARLWSVLFLLVTTAGVWLLAGELFGRDRQLQLVAAGTVGMWPMLDFVSAAVNPDSLMYATSSLALWLGVRIIRRGLTPVGGAAFAATVGLAMVTKATGLALFPPALFVIALGLWRLLRGRAFGRSAIGAVCCALAFLAFVGTWKAVVAQEHRAAYGQVAGVTSGVRDLHEFASYVWQYYLPRLPFMHPVHFTDPTVSTYPAYNVWVATGWAAFGWVTVYFPLGAYKWFLAITVLVGIAALVKGFTLVRRSRGSPRLRSVALPVGVFFAIALVVLLGGLHWAEYTVRDPTNQGRYLFPLAGIAGCAVALATTLVPRRWRPAASGAVLGGVLVFQLFCLGLVASHYYAI